LSSRWSWITFAKTEGVSTGIGSPEIGGDFAAGGF
jgi:hypothetical protein